MTGPAEHAFTRLAQCMRYAAAHGTPWLIKFSVPRNNWSSENRTNRLVAMALFIYPSVLSVFLV